MNHHNPHTEYDAWVAEALRESEQLEMWGRELALAQEAYQKQWPHYCRTCGGAGAHHWEEHHDRGFPGEPMSEPCGTCAENQLCPRCGAPGQPEEGEGPCHQCQWTPQAPCLPQP